MVVVVVPERSCEPAWKPPLMSAYPFSVNGACCAEAGAAAAHKQTASSPACILVTFMCLLSRAGLLEHPAGPDIVTRHSETAQAFSWPKCRFPLSRALP